jgi:hypothetical protein
MNPKLASWLRSFAVAALMIGIAGVVLQPDTRGPVKKDLGAKRRHCALKAAT